MAPADLLRPLEGQREETLRVVDSLGEEDLGRSRGSQPTVRQLLVHLAATERVCAELIARAAVGGWVAIDEEDRDAFNNHAGDHRSDGWTLAQVREELQAARELLRSTFDSLQEDDLDRDIRWPDWPARTIRSSIPYMLEHEDSHLDQVRATVEE
jgi:hypothetical protein